MGDTVQFVDTISSTPTVRLDLNDETTFWVKKIDAPPPRLRRSMASNSMRDGIYVGSSSYDARTLTIELECRKSTQDLAATEIQKLWRELDRSLNWIKYQPTGATKPVFFRTFRSDTSGLEDVIAQAAMRTFTVELLAEPFALGLRETLGPYTINNDPAAGSNPGYVDLTGIVGDAPAEAIIWNKTSNRAATLMAIRHGNFSDIRPGHPAESFGPFTDTTNPGGGPDAAMSGTGTNNYVTTNFASGTGWGARLIGNIYSAVTSQVGSWVVYAAVRRSDATSVINAGISPVGLTAPVEYAAVPLSTSRQLIRLGKFSTDGGMNYAAPSQLTNGVVAWAQRLSGTGTLQWDHLFFLPADVAMLEGISHLTSSGTGNNVFDGIADRTYSIEVGGSPLTLATQQGAIGASGRIPTLCPGVTNRLFFLTSASYSGALRVHPKTDTNSVEINYWPRYLHVRPVST